MVEMNKQIEIACDHHEADQFRDWLIAQGYDAKIGRSSGNYIDGIRSTDEINRLWADYCNSD
jgi:hypothetical protein